MHNDTLNRASPKLTIIYPRRKNRATTQLWVCDKCGIAEWGQYASMTHSCPAVRYMGQPSLQKMRQATSAETQSAMQSLEA